MQIRRLRRNLGSYFIYGQIINVPVDIQTMISTLPRQVQDDYAFNVSFKRNLIHRSAAYSGLVKKVDIKAWLDYLLGTPLYQLYNIVLDWSPFEACVETTPQEELDIVDSRNDAEILLASQQSLLWSEDKYVCVRRQAS